MTDEFVDERIVRVGMDEQDLVRGSNNVISALDKLTGALENASEQENDFGTTKEGLEKLASAAEAAQMKFVAMATVVSNVVNSAFNSLTSAIDHVTTRLGFDNLDVMGQWDEGLSKYEDKMTSVKTIMNATGDSIDVVNEKLEALMKYSDETSYDFATMTNAIAKFASYGVDLETSVTAIEGVANWAASAGQDKNQAEMVLNSVGKAMGQGYMSAMYWQTVERANMATEAFKQTVLDTAVAMGKMKKVGDEYFMISSEYSDVLGGKAASKEGVTTMNFRSMLGKKFLDKDIMVKVTELYGKYSSAMIEYSEQTELTVSQLMAAVRRYNKHKRTSDIPEYVFSAVGDYDETIDMIHNLADGMEGMTKTEFDLSKLAFESAQEARTLKMAVESIADASSSLWSMGFEDIFGNQVEGTEFWTDVANNLYDLLVEPMWIAEEALSKGFSGGSKLYTDILTDNTINTEKWEYLLNEFGGTKFKSVVEEAGSISEAFGDPDTAQTVLDAYEDVFKVVRAITEYKTEMEGYGDEDITKWLDDFNSKIEKSTELTAEQKANLKFTYDDLQSIVDLVGTTEDINAGTLTEELELMYKYAESAKEISSPRQQFYDTVNGFIETLDSYEWAGIEALDEALGINADSISDKIRGIIDWFDRLNDAIGIELDGERYETIKETFSNILETFQSLGDVAGTFFSPLKDFMSNLTDLDKISEKFDGLLNTLKNVSETVSSITDRLANGFIIPGIEGIRGKLEDAFSPLKDIKDSIKIVFEMEGVDENWLSNVSQHLTDLFTHTDGSFGPLVQDLNDLQDGIKSSTQMVGEYVSQLSSIFENDTISRAVNNLGKVITEAGASVASLGDLSSTIGDVLDAYNVDPSFLYDTLSNGFKGLLGDEDAKEEFQEDLEVLKSLLDTVKSINEIIKENNKERFDNFVDDLDPGALKSILETVQTLGELIAPLTEYFKDLSGAISDVIDYFNIDAFGGLFDTLQNGIKGLFGDDEAKQEFEDDVAVLREVLDVIKSINATLKENAKEKLRLYIDDLDPGPLKSFLTTIQKIADWIELLKLQIQYVKGEFSLKTGLGGIWTALSDMWSTGLTNGHFDESKLTMFRLAVDAFKLGLEGVRDRLFEQLPEDSWIIKVYNAFQSIKIFISETVHNISEFLFPKLTRELDSYEDLGGKIGVIAEKVKGTVDSIKTIVDGIIESLKKLFKVDLSDVFSGMFKGGSGDLDSPLNSVLNVLGVVGGAIGSFFGIKKLLGWKKNLKEDDTPILDGVSEMFGSLSDDVEKIKESAESIEKAEGVGTKAADVVLKIAGSFLAIAGGMYLIGQIDENKMGSVFKAFTTIAGYLISALAVVMYFKTEMVKVNPKSVETSGSYAIAATIASIAASAWVIIDAVNRIKELVKEDPESAEKAIKYVIKIFKKIAGSAFGLSFSIRRVAVSAAFGNGEAIAATAYSIAATFLALGVGVAAILKAMGTIPTENFTESKMKLVLKLIKQLNNSFFLSIDIKRIVKAGNKISKSDSDSLAAIAFSLAGTFVALGAAVSIILTSLSFANTDNLNDDSINAIEKILKALKKSIFWVSIGVSWIVKSAGKGDFSADQLKMVAVLVAETIGGIAVAVEIIAGAIGTLAALKNSGLDAESALDDVIKVVKVLKGVVLAITVLVLSAALFSAIEGFNRLTRTFKRLRGLLNRFGIETSEATGLGYVDAITKLSVFLVAIGGTIKLIAWAAKDMNDILEESGGGNLVASLLAIMAPISLIFGAVGLLVESIGRVFNRAIVSADANGLGRLIGFTKSRSLLSDGARALRAVIIMLAEFAFMIYEVGRTYERILSASNGDIVQIGIAILALTTPLGVIIAGTLGILAVIEGYRGPLNKLQTRSQRQVFKAVGAILAEFVAGIYVIGEATSAIVTAAQGSEGLEKVKEARKTLATLEVIAGVITLGLTWMADYASTAPGNVSGTFSKVIISFVASILSLIAVAKAVKILGEVDPTNLNAATSTLAILELIAGIATVVISAISSRMTGSSFKLEPLGYFAAAIGGIVAIALALKDLGKAMPEPRMLWNITGAIAALEGVAVGITALLSLVSTMKHGELTGSLITGLFFAEAIGSIWVVAQAIKDIGSIDNLDTATLWSVTGALAVLEIVITAMASVMIALSTVAEAFPVGGAIVFAIVVAITKGIVSITSGIAAAMNGIAKIAEFTVKYADLMKTVNEQDLKVNAKDFGKSAIATFAEAVQGIAEDLPDLSKPMFLIGTKIGGMLASISQGIAGFFMDHGDTVTTAIAAVVASITNAIANNSDAIFNAFDSLTFLIEAALNRALLKIASDNEILGKLMAAMSGYGLDYQKMLDDLEAKSNSSMAAAGEASRRAKLQSMASLMALVAEENDVRNVIAQLNSVNLDENFLTVDRISTLDIAGKSRHGLSNLAHAWGIELEQAKILYKDYTEFINNPPEGYEPSTDAYAKYVQDISTISSLASTSLDGLIGKVKSKVVENVQPILDALTESGVISEEVAEKVNDAIDSLKVDEEGKIVGDVELEVGVKPIPSDDLSSKDLLPDDIREKLKQDEDARIEIPVVVTDEDVSKLNQVADAVWRLGPGGMGLAAALRAIDAVINGRRVQGPTEFFASLTSKFMIWIASLHTDKDNSDNANEAGGKVADNVGSGFSTETDAIVPGLGENVVDGLVRSLTSTTAEKRLTDAGSSLAKSVNAGFKKKQGINSPSKVYKKFGEYLVEGLVNGTEGSLSTLERAGRYMAEAINAGFNFGEIVESIGAIEISDEIKMIADEMDYGAETFKSMMGTYAQLFGDDFTAEKGKTVFDSWINSIYEASDEFGELEKDLDKLLEEEAKLYEEGARRFGSLWDAYDTEFLEEQYEEYQDIMDDYDRDYNWRLEELQQAKRDLEAKGSETKGVDAEISTLQRERSNYEYQLKLAYKDIIDLNKFAVGEYKKVTDSIEDKQDEILKKQEEIFKNLTDNIKDAFDSYSKAWNSMNLATSSSMFEKLEVTPSKTFGQMMAGLRSQSVERQKWLDNLSKLEELGYNKEIINYFKNAGVERAAEVSVLARASEAQVEEMNGLYANLNDTLENETAMKWAYTNDRLDEIVQLGKAMLFAGYSGEDISDMISDYGIDAAAYMKALLGYSSDNQEIAKSYSDTMKNTTKDMANELMGTAIAAYGDEAGVLAKMFDTAKIADVIRPSTEKAIKAAAGIRESSNVTSIAENHETNYNITQNNYSPDPLDETDIYRRTRNLMSSISTRV